MKAESEIEILHPFYWSWTLSGLLYSEIALISALKKLLNFLQNSSKIKVKSFVILSNNQLYCLIYDFVPCTVTHKNENSHFCIFVSISQLISIMRNGVL